ncbi:MAG: hypothetical protein AAF587_45090, partial [Bacteroidota bacterium]
VIDQPEYSKETKECHEKKKELLEKQQRKQLELYEKTIAAQKAKAQARVTKQEEENLNKTQKILDLEMKVKNLELEKEKPYEIALQGKAKTLYENKMRTWRERTAKLDEHRGKHIALVLGQCEKELKNKLKQSAKYEDIVAKGKMLELIELMELTIQTNNEERYPFELAYKQDCNILGFQRNQLSAEDYMDKMITKHEVNQSIGMTRHHPFLLDFVAQEVHQKSHEDLDPDEKEKNIVATEEQYLAYIMIKNSGNGSQEQMKRLASS